MRSFASHKDFDVGEGEPDNGGRLHVFILNKKQIVKVVKTWAATQIMGNGSLHRHSSQLLKEE